MKIARERNFFQVFLFAISSLFFLFLGTSCQKDPVNDISVKLIGSWHQTARSVGGTSATIDSTRLLMQINANQICVLCDSTALAVKNNTIVSRSGWSYSGGLFNLAIDLPASWKPTFNNNTLILERADFSPTGSITKTSLTFQRVPNILFN